MLYVTTSWDDGDVLDLRLAALLERYKAKGTFYIAQTYQDHRLSEAQILELAHTQEVGAHTLNHPHLPRLTRGGKYKEVKGSKDWLERVLGREVPMFCYPFGDYDNESVEVVKEAGFKGARTVVSARTDKGTAYEMPTTLQVYPFPFHKRRRFEPLRQRYQTYSALGVSPWQMTSWQRATRAAFDVAYANGGVFHLWGHSWEVDENTMWDELDAFLKYAASKPDVRFVTNSELI